MNIDILKYEIKYRNDEEVMELIRALKEAQEEIERLIQEGEQYEAF